MSEPRVVKRYANRKLYDTKRSRYVTLDQIAELIRVGQDVKIIDNTSKEDLTSITLAQIIFEQEKKQNSFPPLAAMKDIIQSGGESLHELASQAGARVRSVFRRDGEGLHEVQAVAEGPQPPAEARRDEGGGQESPHSMLRDLIERSQLTFDEWQKRVDEQVQRVVEALAPWTALEKEVVELRQRIAELEHRLGESEPHGAATAGTHGRTA
jgi:polyhydroxyalkanoate synthesis repressor PhaR